MVQERPLKKARVETNVEKGHSYYKVIEGTRYDRELLNQAEAFAKDGQISFPEAQQLWESAQDGQGVTDTEKGTLDYIVKHFKFTDKAASFMHEQLDSGSHGDSRSHGSYYKVVEGVKCDRRLLEMAQGFAQDGQVSVAEAKKLWDAAQDGKVLTRIEKQTLEYTLQSMKYTAKAAEFMREQLERLAVAPQQQTVDGVEYDHSLLEMASAFAKDGQVSFQEAQQLLEAAHGNAGVPEIEARTLRYTLTAFKYTDKARRLIDAALEKAVSSSDKKQTVPDSSVEKQTVLESADAFTDVLKYVMRRTRCEERGLLIPRGSGGS